MCLWLPPQPVPVGYILSPVVGMGLTTGYPATGYPATGYPAAGYPACPDHTEKRPLFNLLHATKHTGIELTESMAMTPASSVSGLYFSHPESRYFPLGRIDREQAADYAARKGWTLETVEKWLSPNLGYDP